MPNLYAVVPLRFQLKYVKENESLGSGFDSMSPERNDKKRFKKIYIYNDKAKAFMLETILCDKMNNIIIQSRK